jgi:hypothetical protein
MVRVEIFMPVPMRDHLDGLAKADGVTIGEFLRSLVSFEVRYRRIKKDPASTP